MGVLSPKMVLIYKRNEPMALTQFLADALSSILHKIYPNLT